MLAGCVRSRLGMAWRGAAEHRESVMSSAAVANVASVSIRLASSWRRARVTSIIGAGVTRRLCDPYIEAAL